MMIRDEKGFSLVELMVTMVIFVIVIAAASQVFTALLTQFKQQSKIGESNMEGMVGLQILRRDLAGAGFGLPQDMSSATYAEAVNDDATGWDDTAYNNATANAPAAVRSGAGAGLNGSDVLVIKSSNVAFSDGAQKWTYIMNDGNIKGWGAGSSDNLKPTDRVIVIIPNSVVKRNILKYDATKGFYAQFSSIPSELKPKPGEFSEPYGVIYGIDSNNDPRMPFNRADYYVKVPTTGTLPLRCASNTGILYKGVVNQSNGEHTELPLIDCVIGMKVDYWLDTNGDGVFDRVSPDPQAPFSANDTVSNGMNPTNDINALTDANCSPATDLACAVRRQLKEVRVYIVAQEGQRDTNYDYDQGRPPAKAGLVEATEYFGDNSRTFTVVNLQTVFGVGNTDYKYYRWKLYTLSVQPNNLR